MNPNSPERKTSEVLSSEKLASPELATKTTIFMRQTDRTALFTRDFSNAQKERKVYELVVAGAQTITIDIGEVVIDMSNGELAFLPFQEGVKITPYFSDEIMNKPLELSGLSTEVREALFKWLATAGYNYQSILPTVELEALKYAQEHPLVVEMSAIKIALAQQGFIFSEEPVIENLSTAHLEGKDKDGKKVKITLER